MDLEVLLDKVKIHRIVCGEPPDEVVSILSSWDVAKEQYDIVDWGLESLRSFFTEEFPQYLDVIENFNNIGEVADFCRLAIIYKFGGIYMDWDIELMYLKSFTDFVNRYTRGYVIKDNSINSISTEHFCLEKECAFLLDIMEAITVDSRLGAINSVLYHTGTYRWSGVFSSRDYCIPVVRIDELFSHNYSDYKIRYLEGNHSAPLKHHWLHTWVRKGNPFREQY